MAAGRATDVLLSVGIVLAVAAVGVLAYGLVTRTATPRTAPTPEPDAGASYPGARIQVEVFNAAGVDGLAAAATAHLRRRGFDVLQTGNAPEQDTSAVVVRAGTDAAGARVAAALGLPRRAVGRDSLRTDYDPDVTIRLGRDFPARAPFDLAPSDVSDS